MDLEEFLDAYIMAALWSSTDDEDVPLDSNYNEKDIHPDTRERMKQDCEKFIRENEKDLLTWNESGKLRDQYSAEEMGGHDFWLTRNGHGAGFWDGDWDEAVGERLTEASKKFGEVDLYVGDDGLIHAM